MSERIYNHITAMFTFQFQLRGKHYRHPIAVMGVVDIFGLYLSLEKIPKLNVIFNRNKTFNDL